MVTRRMGSRDLCCHLAVETWIRLEVITFGDKMGREYHIWGEKYKCNIHYLGKVGFIQGNITTLEKAKFL